MLSGLPYEIGEFVHLITCAQTSRTAPKPSQNGSGVAQGLCLPPRGKVHHHTQADNVYIVKRGEGTLTVDGEVHVIRENDVVYIPAGMKHALSNLGDEVFEIFEIYAPSGQYMDFVRDD